MALLSTSSRLIKVGQDYSAGSGISINDHVISVTGEFGKTYSAGENISIDNNVINSKDWTGDIANASANAYNQATAQIPEPFDPSYLSGEIDNKLNSTAFTTWQNGQYSTDLQTIEGQINNKLDTSSFSDVSGSFLTAINIPESATWNEVSQAYEQASGTYLTAHQDLSNYYTKDETSGKEQLAQAFANIPAGDTEVNAYVHNNSASIDGTSTVVQSNSSTWSDITAYQSNSASYLTAINIPESATWNDVSETVQTNSSNWDNVTNKLDTTSFSDVSGDFLTTSFGISESATWNETSDVVQSNSAQWAEGGSTSGFVSGTNIVLVPDFPGATNGRVYSATVSGDVTVSIGYYFNSGADIDINRTYSLSSMGSQLENKLDKSVIGNSKTLSMISNTAEVYAIGYKPTEFVTTGITIRNYSNDHTFSFYISPNDYLYSANFVVESDGFDTNRIPSDWVFVNSANGSASFCKYYKDGVQSDNADYFDYNHTITNASAYVVAHKSRVIDALAFKSDLTGEPGDTEVNELVHTNSATWNTVTDKLDTTAQVVTGYTTATIEGTNVINSLNGKALISFRAASAQQAGVADNARYDDEGNNLADTHNSLTALTDVVQTNSAQWGNETISSYTSAWSTDVPPYGGYVINSLNGKYLSAYISRSAENAATAHIADLAIFTQTVDETKLVNDGFVKNLSSDYGTISVVRNTIESTNSAISRVGNEGFVSSFQDESIGPTVTANFSWDKSLPNTTFNFKTDYAPNNTKVTYSANTNLTGEVTVTAVGELTFNVSVPNATGLNVWSDDWVQIKNNVASAADSFETVVGELAWASALPTFEYDNTNKISAINGSALAGGGDVPTGTMNVSGLEYNAVNEISAYNGSAIAQYGAEKQWLVHDDTIVHIANSAQYAFGCNVSALQRLMGIDETVLWSGSLRTTGTVITLNDNMTNYNRIKITTLPEFSTKNQRPAQEVFLNTNYLTTESDNIFAQWQSNERAAGNTIVETWYLSGAKSHNSACLTQGSRWVDGTYTNNITSYTGALAEIHGIGRKQ